jgi:hypothetical protein
MGVSLLFFGYELKRANEIAEAEATSTVYEMDNNLSTIVITDQTARQALSKMSGVDSESHPFRCQPTK